MKKSLLLIALAISNLYTPAATAAAEPEVDRFAPISVKLYYKSGTKKIIEVERRCSSIRLPAPNGYTKHIHHVRESEIISKSKSGLILYGDMIGKTFIHYTFPGNIVRYEGEFDQDRQILFTRYEARQDGSWRQTAGLYSIKEDNDGYLRVDRAD